jgi:hypothetical protein
VDGIRFASQKEARRYQELRLLEKAGEVAAIELQVPYVLSANGKTLGKYVADFVYIQRNGVVRVEDVKGFKTPLYKWKRKHVEAQYGVQIIEI